MGELLPDRNPLVQTALARVQTALARVQTAAGCPDRLLQTLFGALADAEGL
ncbi:hypothetical protein X734_25470 [Mesorhizobium sp. L2C084A000]|nr:hypothetical protein X734_25470 [Mesorhizobium sp. L2C084A000]